MLFADTAAYYDKLEAVSSRLSMIDLMAELLAKADKKEIRALVYTTQGILAPPFESVEIGIAEKLAEQAIGIATGYTVDEVHALYKKSGDLGSSAEALVGKTKLRSMDKTRLHIQEVFDSMQEIAKISGEGSKDSKLKKLAGLLAHSTPVEARYITRFALGKLRLGLGDATILEALAKAFTGSREAKVKLESAYNLCSDLGRVGEVLATKGMPGIEKFGVTLFSPIRPELAERANTFEEIMERMKDRCFVEPKYDGLRAQVHMDAKAKRVEIFSRNLERLTMMFPDIAKAALKDLRIENAILEGEIISYDEVSGEFHSFQETIQRRRKYDVKEKSEEFPVHLFCFDLMYLNGESYIEKSYEKRRESLEKILKGDTLQQTERTLVTKPKQMERYFDKYIGSGLEGLMAKDPNSNYIAGARKFSWIKMKRSYRGELSDTVDLVIIGYYLGKGARTEFGFGGLLAAVYNEKRDVFESITRIGTGFTEEQMKFFQNSLKVIKSKTKPARVVSTMEPDVWVNPVHVVEVRADEITRSPMHMCGKENYDDQDEPGYALRFPRIISDGFRDKKAEDATSTKEIKEMFAAQKKKKLEEK